jgi:anaerobic magnesium-protoporphyrin IX monomethyl ester cyclase
MDCAAMRILLIYPSVAGSSALWMPMGLAFIAAELRRQGHTVAIFDRYARQAKTGYAVEPVNEAMLACIGSFQPDLVGLSTLTEVIYDTVDCVRLIKAHYEGLLVAGGYHATALPELMLRKMPGLDGVITGEGELVLPRIAKGENPADIPGVWWRKGETILRPRGPAEQIEKLDELELPALDLMDMAFYTQRTYGVIRGHNLRAATLITSRGCYRNCRFCAESVTYGHGVRFHSAGYTLEWIQRVIKDYSVEGIHFHDNDFLADEGRARDICEGLVRAGLHRTVKWSIQARAERVNPAIVKLLKSAGCCLVEIGVEAGTQFELDRIKKGATVEMNTQAVRLCRKAALDVHAYMLSGLEDETISDLEQRLRWVRRAKPTSFEWSQVTMFPGTALYQEKGNDFFALSDWTRTAIIEYYSTQNLSSIPAETRRNWMARYFAPYARRHWWMNTLKRYPLRALGSIFLKLEGKIKHKILGLLKRNN